MRRWFCKRLSAQSGVYIVFTALASIMLLSVVGLGIDTGFIFRRQKQLQNALDMAAFAGASQLNEGVPGALVQEYARRLALENLRLMNFSTAAIAHANSTLSVQVLNGESQIVVTARSLQENLILGTLPGYPDVSEVPAEASAVMAPISVMLALDVSGSMQRCMIDDTGLTHPNCPPGDTGRLEAAKISAKTLVDALKIRDQIGLLTYSTNVTLNRPMTAELTAGNLAATKTDFKNAIDALVANGSTNIWTAMGAAKDEMEAKFSPGASRQKVILILSDGSPYEPNMLPIPSRPPGCEQSLGAWQGLYARAVNNAIEAQRLGSKVHAVGIGTEDTNVSSVYQSVGNPYLVKSLLMIEMANDQQLMQNPYLFPLPGPPTPYMWDLPCMTIQGVPGPITGANRAAYPTGKYAFATDAGRLQEIFDDVIRAYRVRLK